MLNEYASVLGTSPRFVLRRLAKTGTVLTSVEADRLHRSARVIDLAVEMRGVFEKLQKLSFSGKSPDIKGGAFGENDTHYFFGPYASDNRYHVLMQQISQSDDISLYVTDGCLRVCVASGAVEGELSNYPGPDTWEKGYAFDAGGCGDNVPSPHVNNLDGISTLPLLGARRALSKRWVIYVARGGDFN